MIRTRSPFVIALTLTASTLLAACGSSDGASDGTGGGAHSGASGVGGSGNGTGGSSAPGEGGSAGGSGVVEGAPVSCEDFGGDDPDPAYPGFDRTILKDTVAPEGCEGGFEPDRTWTLQMAASDPLLRISFANGVVHANGVACTSQGGDAAEISPRTKLRVVGTAATETVVLDFADGVPDALDWSATTGLEIEFRGGDDHLVVRGSEGADSLDFSAADEGAELDFDGDGLPDALMTKLADVVVALGPGNDHVDAFGVDVPLAVPIAACGGAGDDELRGGAGIDRLEGGDGDDRVVAAPRSDAADLVSGGAGFDCADYRARTDAVALSLDDDADDGAADEGDNVLQDVECLVGGAGADALVGSSVANRIEGNGGDDTIEPRDGDDVVYGGDGDDTIVESEEDDGADYVDGGAGTDAVSYAGRLVGVEVTLCASDPAAPCTPDACSCAADDGAPGESDRVVDVEIAHGTEGADHLVGTTADDTFYAYGGDDRVEGLAGNDAIYGDDGDDTMDGAEGDDFLDGSSGFDVFDAGMGDGDICIVDADEEPAACELF